LCFEWCKLQAFCCIQQSLLEVFTNKQTRNFMKKLICSFLVALSVACVSEVGDVATSGAAGNAAKIEVSSIKPELALATYTIQNGGSIGSESTLNALRALAMGYGNGTANFWSCTTDPGTNPEAARCAHGTDVLHFYGCTTINGNGQPQRHCNIGLGFATIGTAHWTRTPSSPWYVVYDVRPNYPGYAVFKSSPRQLVGCNMVTHPCPNTQLNSSWPIQ
jgi:hypothetical protein